MKHAKTIVRVALVTPVLLLAAGTALAQELGQVISSTPVTQQVGVPRQVCTTEQVAVQAPKSGATLQLQLMPVGAPAYPSYYPQPYYPPIAIQFGVCYWGSSRYRH